MKKRKQTNFEEETRDNNASHISDQLQHALNQADLDDTSSEDEEMEIHHGESSQERGEHDHLIAPTDQSIKTKKRGRGRTRMEEIHARRLEDRVAIVLNEKNQPVGPNKKIVGHLSSFLGTLARFPQHCPLDCVSWKHLTTKNDMWEYTKLKWLIPEEGKKWVLATINSCWRRYKKTVKEKYIQPYDTDEERLENLPIGFNVEQFKGFLKITKSKNYKIMEKKNIRNRKKQNSMHTTGRTSFALVEQKLKMENVNHEPPSKGKMFLETRKCVPGREYKTDDAATQHIITQMEEIGRTQGNSVDPFCVLMSKEHPGRVRLEGRAVIMSDLKNKASTSGVRVHEDVMSSMFASMEARMASAEASAASAQAIALSAEEKMSQMMAKLQNILPKLDTTFANMLAAEFYGMNNASFAGESRGSRNENES